MTTAQDLKLTLSDPFRPEAISPETRRITGELAATLALIPDQSDLAVARDAYVRGRSGLPVSPRSPRARTMTVPGPAGDILLRILAPDTVRGVYFYVHGGAWTFGANDTWDAQLELCAREAGVACVALDYRLAPEDPFPAAVDDCVAAARWLIEQGSAEFGTTRMAIGGESAGAHLAAETLLRLRDAGQGGAFRGANLLYGIYDLSLTPSARRAVGTAFIDGASLTEMVADFRGDVDPRDARLSPLYADLRDLPPALFSVGTVDPLLDDSLFMYSRWRAAGNQAELALYPGGVHAFNAFEGELAAAANLRVAAFLRATLGETASAS